ncbi:hypothetical protein MBLNU459_g3221t1 [Dothideomycetes sp. NU459]
MPESSSHPRATPTIQSGGIFSPYSSSTIQAPAQAVYEAIIKTSDYSEWNTFVPSVAISKHSPGVQDPTVLAKDTAMTLKVNMTSTVSTQSKELVSSVDPPPASHPNATGKVTRVCWVLDNKAAMVPRFMLHTERVNEIDDLGDGTCVYRTWGTFGGPLAWIVKWKYEQTLQERFDDWVKDLKKYVEAKEARKRQMNEAVELPA